MSWLKWAGLNGMKKSKTAIDLGGLCEDTFGGSRRGVENITEWCRSGDRWWIQ